MNSLGVVGLDRGEGLAKPEGHGLHEHPGQDVLLVAEAARHGHGAAEHVGEQHDEDDGEEQGPGDELWLADPVGDIPLGDEEPVAERPAQPLQRPVRLCVTDQGAGGGHRRSPSWSAGRGPAALGGLRGLGGLGGLGAVTGEAQEHVVEGGLAQGDVGHRDAALLQPRSTPAMAATRSSTGAEMRRCSRPR
jgi:hypothetical protein